MAFCKISLHICMETCKNTMRNCFIWHKKCHPNKKYELETSYFIWNSQFFIILQWVSNDAKFCIQFHIWVFITKILKFSQSILKYYFFHNFMFKMIDFKNLQNFVTNYIHVASYNVPKIFKNTIFTGILVFWTLKKTKFQI